MTLQLIGAGLPRTGTSSLREALRYLLDAPVYHMSEAFAHPEHARTWVAAIEGDPPDWEEFLAGYDRWLGEVRAGIAPERLVEWQPGDGWGPICRALGVPVPDLPFPHENRSTDYAAREEARGHSDAARVASVRSSSQDTHPR